jgi:hypothetical protein
MTNFVRPGVRGTRQRDPIVILVRYALESTSPDLHPCREDRYLKRKCACVCAISFARLEDEKGRAAFPRVRPHPRRTLAGDSMRDIRPCKQFSKRGIPPDWLLQASITAISAASGRRPSNSQLVACSGVTRVRSAKRMLSDQDAQQAASRSEHRILSTHLHPTFRTGRRKGCAVLVQTL